MDGIRQPQQQNTAPDQESRGEERETRPPEEESKEEGGAPAPSGGGQKGLSGMTAGFLIAVAMFFDGLQALVITIAGLTVFLSPLGIALAWVFNIFAAGTFYLWLHSLGLSMIKKGGGTGFSKSPWPFILGGFVFEFIPGINALPGWTGVIFALIMRERTGRYLSYFTGGEKTEKTSV